MAGQSTPRVGLFVMMTHEQRDSLRRLSAWSGLPQTTLVQLLVEELGAAWQARGPGRGVAGRVLERLRALVESLDDDAANGTDGASETQQA